MHSLCRRPSARENAQNPALPSAQINPHASLCGWQPQARVSSIWCLEAKPAPHQPSARPFARRGVLNGAGNTACRPAQTTNANNHESRSLCPRLSAGCGWWLFAQSKSQATSLQSNRHRAFPSVAKIAAHTLTDSRHSGVVPQRTTCQTPNSIYPSPTNL